MSKKNLLNESTIRKFMKLASIEPLASDFIGRIKESDEELEEQWKPGDVKKMKNLPTPGEGESVADFEAKLKKAASGETQVATPPSSPPARPKQSPEELAKQKAAKQLKVMAAANKVNRGQSVKDFEDMLDKALKEEDLDPDLGAAEEELELGAEEELELGAEEEEAAPSAEVSLDEEEVEALRAALEAAQSVMDKLEGGLEDEPMGDDDLGAFDDEADDELDAEIDDDESMPMAEEDETLAETIYKQVLKKLSNRR